MSYWTHDKVPNSVWIALALVIPVVFNLLNVRKNGEVEYWITMTKVTMLVILTMAGILLAFGAAPGPYLLGTDANYHPVPCDLNDPLKGPCLLTPGFNCTSSRSYCRLIQTGEKWRGNPSLRRREQPVVSLRFGNARVEPCIPILDRRYWEW